MKSGGRVQNSKYRKRVSILKIVSGNLKKRTRSTLQQNTARLSTKIHHKISKLIIFISRAAPLPAPLLLQSTMKSFIVFIGAALIAAVSAVNEPVASPSAAIEAELAAFERQLGTDIPGTPTASPRRPTPNPTPKITKFPTVSFFLSCRRCQPAR